MEIVDGSSLSVLTMARSRSPSSSYSSEDLEEREERLGAPACRDARERARAHEYKHVYAVLPGLAVACMW